jgi:hypothetical protein
MNLARLNPLMVFYTAHCAAESSAPTHPHMHVAVGGTDASLSSLAISWARRCATMAALCQTHHPSGVLSVLSPPQDQAGAR